MPQRQKRSRIFILDSHPVVREGLVHLIGREPDLVVCGQEGHIRLALKTLGAVKPDLLITGLDFTGMGGIKLLQLIKARYPDLRILVFSIHDGIFFAERSFQAGARGYLHKTAPASKIISTIRQILRGRAVLPHRGSRIVLNGPSGKTRETTVDILSDRELQVFRLIGKGWRTNQIAKQLNLSHKTIESYRENIKIKLNLSHGNELLPCAIQFALVEALHR